MFLMNQQNIKNKQNKNDRTRGENSVTLDSYPEGH